MRRPALLVTAALALCCAGGCISVSPFGSERIQPVVVQRSPRWIEPNRIALIDVSGYVTSRDVPRFFRATTSSADIKERLDRAAGDSRVKAVLLRINSPGGEVSASDIIHEEVRRFRRTTGKPVIACITDLGASGGYYVAAAADRIIVAPTAITGSIGVIMQFVNVEGLYGKIGLQAEVIKSGEKKDIGSPTRAMTPDERALLDGVNRRLFERFLSIVRAGRPAMTEADMAYVSDGRILTAEETVAHHLADRIGYLEDAIEEARQMAGIGGASVILYRAGQDYNSNIYAAAMLGGVLGQSMEMLMGRNGPAFLYLWSPGS